MPSAQRTVFHADWALGRKAGPIRNRTMASYADACILLPGGRGTQNMKEEADRMKLLVLDLRRLGDVP